MYFGENDTSNVLKSLNIGHVINTCIALSIQFVVSMLNLKMYYNKK